MHENRPEPNEQSRSVSRQLGVAVVRGLLALVGVGLFAAGLANEDGPTTWAGLAAIAALGVVSVRGVMNRRG